MRQPAIGKSFNNCSAVPGGPPMRRLRLALVTLGVVSLPLIAASAHAATTPNATPKAPPTAAQLLAKTSTCSVASKGKYKTDEDAGSATVNICKSGTAFFWKADMDIDCDGIATSVCNKSKDPDYQGQ